MKIAVTGGMGCGKSTVVQAMRGMLPNYVFASYDDGVHEMYERNESFREALRVAFGTDVRAEVARQVFNNPKKLAHLFQMTYGPMDAYMQRVTSNLQVVMEVPMLYQIPGATELFDYKLAVWCDDATQRARIKARDGLSDEMIARKLAVQLSPQTIEGLADGVIYTNDGAPDVKEQLLNVLPLSDWNRV